MKLNINQFMMPIENENEIEFNISLHDVAADIYAYA